MITSMKKASVPVILTIIATLSLLATPTGCIETQTGPQVTRQEIKRETQRIEVKRQEYKKDRRLHPYAGYGLAKQEQIVNAIGHRILRESGINMNIKFTVDKSEQVNAAASPGQIVVTIGMMRFVRSEDELASVIGHEIAHLTNDHVTKSMITNVPVMIGSMIADALSPGSGKVVQMGGGVFTQKYSRDMEREADYYGIIYAHNAGYNARAGVDVWERFALELPQSQQQNIFGSHPTSTERIIRARKIADSLQGQGKVSPPSPK